MWKGSFFLNQEIEIECKNILTLEEFDSLVEAFSLTSGDFKLQVNHYFDTLDFSLKASSSALRIRVKGERYTLTLKQPARIGLLETHQPLTQQQANLLLTNGVFPAGDISTLIHQQGIDPTNIFYFGSLTTNRAELVFENGLLVLDHSHYLNTDDYEIEYEVSDEKAGQVIFNKLLKTYHIPIRITENKIIRFYLRKQTLLNGD